MASRVLRGGTVILKIDCQLIVNEGDCQNVTEPQVNPPLVIKNDLSLR